MEGSSLLTYTQIERELTKSPLLKALDKGLSYNELRPLMGRNDPRPWIKETRKSK